MDKFLQENSQACMNLTSLILGVNPMVKTFSSIILALLIFAKPMVGLSDEKPFVTATLLGELGNQFFIIAAANSLAIDHNARATFPDLEENQGQNIPLNRKHVFPHVNAEYPAESASLYYEPYFHYAPIPYVPNMRIQGFFQSEKYFAHHKQEILNLFAPSEQIMQYLRTKYSDILDDPHTVSIHLRFYHEDPDERFYLGCRREFIEKAIALFPEETNFIVFSNRMERAKQFLTGINRSFRFIEGEAHYHDFYLMSRCRHNIICNSTFSWWAAYLNPNPSKIVVAPGKWFTKEAGLSMQDLIPETWVTIN